MDNEAGAAATATPAVARAANDGTFTVTLPSNKAVVVARRPQGVLKLRIKRLVGESSTDPEIAVMTTAVLSIVSYNGEPPVLRTPLEYEAFLQRFGTDDDMTIFVNEFQRNVNPEAMEIVDKALAEGLEQGLTGDALQAHVAKSALEYQRQHVEAVRE